MKLDNEMLSTYIYDIIDGILKSDDTKDAKNLFFMLLDGIKKDSELGGLLDSTIMTGLVRILPELECLDDRLEAMNAVLSIMCYQKYEDNNQINELFQLCLECISEGYSYFSTIKEAIGLFHNLGIDYDFIFEQFVNRYCEEYCIEIFSEIDGNLSCETMVKYVDIIDAIELIKKRTKRFDIILHFYLMTDSQWIEYFDVIKDYLRTPRSYSKLCSNWIFSSENYEKDDALETILSEQEQRIFRVVGDIYNSCKDKSIVINSKEKLNNYLERTSDKFHSILKTDEMKALLEEFKAGRDFVEIAVHFPN